MIKAINEFAEQFEVKTRVELRLTSKPLSYYNIEDYAKIKKHLLKEGFKLTERGENRSSTFGSNETWIAEYEKDGIELQVWYEKTKSKADRCAELRKELEEMGCSE